jgi:hypothetical protein
MTINMMKKLYTLIAASLLVSTSASADNWDLTQDSVTLGIADIDWTVDPKYHGTKLLVAGRYVISHEDATKYDKDAELVKHIVHADLQIGDSDTGLEYGIVDYTFWAYQKKQEFKSSGNFNTVRDQLELGKVMASVDDTLGVDSYIELTAGRVGRFWAYKGSDNSKFKFTFGLNGSLGWAWTEAADPAYGSVSNPTLGLWNVIIFEFDRIGQFYIDSRVVSGYTFGEPKQTLSREANARFGYRKDFANNIALDVFGEKRSFHFAAFDIPDQYNKARRIAVEASYKF